MALFRNTPPTATPYLENAQFAVQVNLRARQGREGGEAGGDDGAGFEETPPGDRGANGGIGHGFHGNGDSRPIMHTASDVSRRT
jgi:hypothetical protein